MNRSRAFGRTCILTLAIVFSVSGVFGVAPVGAVEPGAGAAGPLATAVKPSIAAGEVHTVGLKSDGTVVATGWNGSSQCDVSGWSDIVGVAAGDAHTVGIKSGGTVVATGRNDDGQCNVASWSDIVGVAASYDHTVGLKSDGTVVATGGNGFGQCDVSGWSEIVGVAAGHYYTVGLKSDGTVVAIGEGGFGQCDVAAWTDIVEVAVGAISTIGRRSNGTVVATGWNTYGQCNVADWTDISAVAAGGTHTVGLTWYNTVVAVGGNSYGQCDTSDWTDIAVLDAGENHTVGLKPDGTVVATGLNNSGECDVSGWDLGWTLPAGAFRVAGTSRYGTAIEASKRAYPGGAGTVVIATGQNWPDALGGAALAGVVDGPLLLTSSKALPAAVSAEITRLKAKKAYVLGGSSAVGPSVLTALRAKLGTANVTVLAGADRYTTAHRIADEVVALQGAAWGGLVLVSRGDSYPDALAGSPIAAAFGAPILLAKPRAGAPALPTGAKRAAILGSTGAVSSAVESSLRAKLGTANVTRLGGTTRYQTAALVAEYGVGLGLSWDGVGIATGTNFPDALSGGAMLGEFRSVMLLTPGFALHSAPAHVLTDNAAAIDAVFILGGTSAVSEAVQGRVFGLVQ